MSNKPTTESATACGLEVPRKSLAILATLSLAAALLVLPFSTTIAKSEPAHAAADLSQINVNDGFAELVKAVKPAVVNISVTGSASARGDGKNFNFQGQPELEEFFKRFFGEIPKNPRNGDQNNQPYERKTTAVGSGFIIDPSGLVVTNYHVIENADEIEVVFDDGTRIPAKLKGTDAKTDLAILEIETDQDLPYVIFGDSDAAQVGDWVVAIGNPFGLGGTTTSGIISARGRNINSGPLDDFIQIDAPINRGNSGGPLFNTRGEVIGVNSAIFSPNGGSVGIGFAIPASMANNVVTQLAESGTVERGYLGVHIQSLTEEIADNLGLKNASGALVTEVLENTPAEDAGIEAGDVIIAYDGNRVEQLNDLPKLVALTRKGSTVKVKVWRNEKSKILSVTVGTNEQDAELAGSPAQPDPSELGLNFAAVDSDSQKKYGLDEEASGVIIVHVEPESSAAKRGLREGDLIKRVDKTDVENPQDVIQAIQQSRDLEKDSVLLLVERNKQARFIVVPMNA